MLCYPWAYLFGQRISLPEDAPALGPPELVHRTTESCRVTAVLLLPLELDAAVCMKPDASADKTRDARSQSAGLGVSSAAFTIRSPGAATKRHPSNSTSNLPSPEGNRSSWKPDPSHPSHVGVTVPCPLPQ